MHVPPAAQQEQTSADADLRTQGPVANDVLIGLTMMKASLPRMTLGAPSPSRYSSTNAINRAV